MSAIVGRIFHRLIPRIAEYTEDRRVSWHRSSQIAAIYAALCAGAVILTTPFAWMISTSLKSPDQVFLWPVSWIPSPIIWNNYIDAFTVAPFWLFTLNTTVITVLSIIGNLMGSSLAAYGFARLRFPGRTGLFLVMLSTMMVPYAVTMIPLFILFNYLGWIDTFLPLIIPNFFAIPIYTFLLRQFFLSIPLELEEAARIDGCGSLGIFLRIVLPLSAPALATVVIFAFIGNWNDFLAPLIYLQDEAKYTLALGMRMFENQYYTNYPLLMAVSTMAVAPCVLLFFVAQRQFIQGIVVTGVKG